jgi:Domain of unknown function (DUF4340)
MMRPAQVLSLAVAGLALVGIGLWLLSRHGPDSTAQPNGPVLPLKQADLNAVTRLRIFKGDGSHATLTRAATGWLLVERGYPADTGQVRKLLLDLADLQIEEQKTSDPALYSKLGVEDPRDAQSLSTGVDIDLNARTLGLIVGKTSGTGSVYVRVAGATQSLLANPQLTPDADPRHWLDRAILDIAADQVNEVDVKAASGPEYAVKRSAAGNSPDYALTPLPKGRELADPGAPAAQAGGLVGLQLDDVRKAAAHAPVAQATFHMGDGLVVTLAGIQDGETRYISVAATASTPAAQPRARDLNARLAGWEFELPGYRYDTLFHPLAELLKPLPAPSSAPRATPLHSPVKVTPQQSH